MIFLHYHFASLFADVNNWERKKKISNTIFHRNKPEKRCGLASIEIRKCFKIIQNFIHNFFAEKELPKTNIHDFPFHLFNSSTFYQRLWARKKGSSNGKIENGKTCRILIKFNNFGSVYSWSMAWNSILLFSFVDCLSIRKREIVQ